MIRFLQRLLGIRRQTRRVRWAIRPGEIETLIYLEQVEPTREIIWLTNVDSPEEFEAGLRRAWKLGILTDLEFHGAPLASTIR